MAQEHRLSRLLPCSGRFAQNLVVRFPERRFWTRALICLVRGARDAEALILQNIVVRFKPRRGYTWSN
jgi:hypothetical protein